MFPARPRAGCRYHARTLSVGRAQPSCWHRELGRGKRQVAFTAHGPELKRGDAFSLCPSVYIIRCGRVSVEAALQPLSVRKAKHDLQCCEVSGCGARRCLTASRTCTASGPGGGSDGNAAALAVCRAARALARSAAACCSASKAAFSAASRSACCRAIRSSSSRAAAACSARALSAASEASYSASCCSRINRL